MASQTVLILDFGGQYKELIARRVRECAVYSVVLPGDTDVDKIRALDPIGIILTGGPNSVYDERSPHCDPALFRLGVPVLGICYGAQLMAWMLGGKIEGRSRRAIRASTERQKWSWSRNAPCLRGLRRSRSV